MRFKYSRFILMVFLGAALLPAGSFAEEGDIARKLINSQGCKACHSQSDDEKALSVSFKTMRKTLTRDEIRSMLVNPEHIHGNMKIKDFSHLSDDEINALVEFIKPEK